MRVGIIGDTHGDLRTARLLLSRLGDIEVLLHTGDYYDDAMQMACWPELRGIPVYAVMGNGDYAVNGPRQVVVHLAGRKVLLVHGHQHDVKRGMTRLAHDAGKVSPDVVVFGHTHVAGIFREQGLLLVNPGSPSLPRRRACGSGAVLDIQPDGIVPQLIDLA
ncbi:MAG: metallophosphoesterase family protein [Bacillota bacterium]